MLRYKVAMAAARISASAAPCIAHGPDTRGSVPVVVRTTTIGGTGTTGRPGCVRSGA